MDYNIDTVFFYFFFVCVCVCLSLISGTLGENKCSLYVLYKIALTLANFVLTQLKMHSHLQVGEC